VGAAPREALFIATLTEVVLYDGVCGLCNRFVRFVLPRDPDGRFRFASLQGAVGRDLLARHARDARALDTVYVLTTGGELLERSAAVLHVVRQLRGVWRLAGILRWCPTRLLDAAYDAVARRRYRVFGRYEACPLPPPEWRGRFIDE